MAKPKYTESKDSTPTSHIEKKVKGALQSFKATFPMLKSSDPLADGRGKTKYIPKSKSGKGNLFLKYTSSTSTKHAAIVRKLVGIEKDIQEFGEKVPVMRKLAEAKKPAKKKATKGKSKSKSKSTTRRRRSR